MLELLPSIPITQALFPLCMATAKRWIKKGNNLVSLVNADPAAKLLQKWKSVLAESSRCLHLHWLEVMRWILAACTLPASSSQS